MFLNTTISPHLFSHQHQRIFLFAYRNLSTPPPPTNINVNRTTDNLWQNKKYKLLLLKLSKKSDPELASWYFNLAFKKYRSKYPSISPCMRGIYIHYIAEQMAIWHRRLMKKYGEEYRFEIEQSYLNGKKIPYDTSGCVRPDLYNAKTGAVFDYKTGEAKTDHETHTRIAANVTRPKYGNYIVSYDVTQEGVKEKFRTKVTAENHKTVPHIQRFTRSK